MTRTKILLSWSGGKDSAWAMWRLRSVPELAAAYEVVGLVTTVNEVFRRVAIHGFREELLQLQAAETGLPLWTVPLPFPCTNAIYEQRMSAVHAQAVEEGIGGVAFGDLYLEDIRAYRLRTLAGTGLQTVFPLWRIPTAALAEEMLDGGLQARITCCDPRVVPADWAGRAWDPQLLAELPLGATPAERMASSTPSATRGRCSRGQSRWWWGSGSAATASGTGTCLRGERAKSVRSPRASVPSPPAPVRGPGCSRGGR